MDLDSLERKIIGVESILVMLTIASIAISDAIVGKGISLGPLYLIPLSYSALTHRLKTTIALIVACVFLRQLFGPLGNSSDPWFFLFRDLAIAAVFVVLVVFLRRLGGERRRIFELARAQRNELTREVEMAAAVQRRLISLNDPPVSDFEIAAKTEPLRGVGGDYYDFIDLGDRQCGIVIADISGKGMPAALLMPALRLGIRSLVAGRGTPSERIRLLNDEFCRTTDPRHYGTLFYARIDLDDGRLTWVNAGHVPALLLDAKGACRTLDSGGPPVGLLDDSTYRSEEVTLEPGGVLLLYTDGVTEAVNPEDEELGLARLTELLVASRSVSADELVAAVFERVHDFQGGRAAGDDITVIAIRRPS